MLIISDTGTDVVNSDAAFVFSLAKASDQTDVLLAYGPGVQTVLAAMGDRPAKALEAIVKGIKERRHILDLNDLLGARPNLAVARPALVVPNGGKLSSPPRQA